MCHREEDAGWQFEFFGLRLVDHTVAALARVGLHVGLELGLAVEAIVDELLVVELERAAITRFP